RLQKGRLAFIFVPRAAYEVAAWLGFRRVAFRSSSVPSVLSWAVAAAATAQLNTEGIEDDPLFSRPPDSPLRTLAPDLLKLLLTKIGRASCRQKVGLTQTQNHVNKRDVCEDGLSR